MSTIFMGDWTDVQVVEGAGEGESVEVFLFCLVVVPMVVVDSAGGSSEVM